MNNDNLNLFDSVEDHIDKQAKSSSDESSTSLQTADQQFKDELAFRNKLMAEWNRAKRVEQIKNQVKTIHMQQKTPKQTLRYFSYAAAACIVVLLAIPGYQYFAKQNSKTLEMNEAEIKSTVTFYDSRYKQISPINGQLFGDESVLFEWETTIDVKTSIIITDTKTGQVVFTRPVNSEVKQFKLNQYLGKGKYSWRLEGFSGEMVFVMK
jgi:hypothetical protein